MGSGPRGTRAARVSSLGTGAADRARAVAWSCSSAGGRPVPGASPGAAALGRSWHPQLRRDEVVRRPGPGQLELDAAVAVLSGELSGLLLEARAVGDKVGAVEEHLLLAAG